MKPQDADDYGTDRTNAAPNHIGRAHRDRAGGDFEKGPC